jgi:preprotein translocase subunit SecD
MMIRSERFNIYLLAALAVVAACGCKSDGEKQPKKLLSTFRLYVEANRDSTQSQEPVPIYREKPVWVTVQKTPFLTEGNVAEAKVIDVGGDFALRIQFDRAGTAMFEQCTTANRGRRIAVFCQFGKEVKDFRWLAAPVISRRTTDGVFVFTPDANREEAEEIALGLNNVAKKTQRWTDR